MTSRIHRGFHRIGVVLAVPLLLAAIGLAGHEMWLQWTTKDPWAAFANAPAPSKPPNVFDQSDPPKRQGGLTFDDITGPATRSDPFSDLDPKAPAYRADYTGALAALALAVFLYTAARAVGWILAGFLTPNGRS